MVKNVKDTQLKKCIFLTLNEYRELILELSLGLKDVKYEEGIYYEDTAKAYIDDVYLEDITDEGSGINEVLSEYFNVEVTSVHTDDCDVVGVWICYKEK